MKRNKHNPIRRATAMFCCMSAILMCSVLFAQQEGPVYIKAKKIYTSDGGRIITSGGILIRDGKIVKVDERIKPPKDARVVDFSENTIIPGLIDAFSHMGFHREDYNVQTEPPNPHRAPLTGIYLLFYGSQQQQTPPPRIEPRFKASNAVYFGDASFPRFLSEGILKSVITIPTTNLSGGMAFAAGLGGGSVSAFEMADPVGMVFVFAGASNVMKRYGDLKKMFQDAQDYRKQQEKYKKDLKKYQDQQKKESDTSREKNDKEEPAAKEIQEPKEPKRNENHEAVLQVLDRKIPVLIKASKENEIQAALKIKDEFKVRLVLVGGQEAYKIPQDLVSRKVSVIAGPDVVLDKKGKRINYIQELLVSGIPVAFCSGSSQGASLIPFQLAFAVQNGLSRSQALDLVTIHPAKIFNLSNRLGSIVAGRDADFVVLDGEPFDLSTNVQWIYIGGQRFFSQE
ncbi:MAG: amidohydrolase family protein [Candidatus Aminicenantes bacterium]|nr:MAG: amidohydrolase family protein [Candidatus Aminicenantes bacterium]